MGTHSPEPFRPGPLSLGALVLVLCALVAATFEGPLWSELQREEETSSETTTDGDGSADAPDESAPQEADDEEEAEDEPWLPWLPPVDLLLLVPTALVFGVAVLVAARLRVRRRRRQPGDRVGPRRSPVDGKEEAPPDEDDLALPEAIDEGARAITEGSPRNAIVATWVRLEQAVEGERFPHRPEETPSELVERALASYHLDGTAIRRLAALYREARFSTHPVTEVHRDEAAECLRRLLASLGPVTR